MTSSRPPYEAIERLSQRYRALMQSLSGGEQMRAERLLGRRVMDLKRLGSLLPKIAVVDGREHARPRRRRAARRASAAHHGRVLVAARPRRARRRRSKVGADVEAWCGKCGESTTHSIVAMVGTDPKQVLCQVCGSRHAYRTGPGAPARRQGRGRGGRGRFAPARGRRSRGAAPRRPAARARRGGRGRRRRAPLRPEGALQGGRDHLARRVRPRQDRERPALEPARPFLGRRPQVADARRERGRSTHRALKRRRRPRGSA